MRIIAQILMFVAVPLIAQANIVEVNVSQGGSLWKIWTGYDLGNHISWTEFTNEFCKINGIKNTDWSMRHQYPGMWKISVGSMSELEVQTVFNAKQETKEQKLEVTVVPQAVNEDLVVITSEVATEQLKEVASAKNIEAMRQDFSKMINLVSMMLIVSEQDEKISALQSQIRDLQQMMLINDQQNNLVKTNIEVKDKAIEVPAKFNMFWIILTGLILMSALAFAVFSHLAGRNGKEELTRIYASNMALQRQCEQYRFQINHTNDMLKKHFRLWVLPKDIRSRNGFGHVWLKPIEEGPNEKRVLIPGIPDPVFEKNINNALRSSIKAQEELGLYLNSQAA